MSRSNIAQALHGQLPQIGEFHPNEWTLKWPPKTSERYL